MKLSKRMQEIRAEPAVKRIIDRLEAQGLEYELIQIKPADRKTYFGYTPTECLTIKEKEKS